MLLSVFPGVLFVLRPFPVSPATSAAALLLLLLLLLLLMLLLLVVVVMVLVLSRRWQRLEPEVVSPLMPASAAAST